MTCYKYSTSNYISLKYDKMVLANNRVDKGIYFFKKFHRTLQKILLANSRNIETSESPNYLCSLYHVYWSTATSRCPTNKNNCSWSVT